MGRADAVGYSPIDMYSILYNVGCFKVDEMSTGGCTRNFRRLRLVWIVGMWMD